MSALIEAFIFLLTLYVIAGIPFYLVTARNLVKERDYGGAVILLTIGWLFIPLWFGLWMAAEDNKERISK